MSPKPPFPILALKIHMFMLTPRFFIYLSNSLILWSFSLALSFIKALLSNIGTKPVTNNKQTASVFGGFDLLPLSTVYFTELGNI